MLDKAKLVKDFDKIGDFIKWGELYLRVTDEGTIVVEDPNVIVDTIIFKEISGFRVEFKVPSMYIEFDTIAQIFDTVEKCLAFQIF